MAKENILEKRRIKVEKKWSENVCVREIEIEIERKRERETERQRFWHVFTVLIINVF